MTNGPPSFAAQSSNSERNKTAVSESERVNAPPISPQSSQAISPQQYYSPYLSQQGGSNIGTNQSYYNYNAWQSAWLANHTYPGNTAYPPSQQYSPSPIPPATLQFQNQSHNYQSQHTSPNTSKPTPREEQDVKPLLMAKSSTPTPSPPPPETYQHWDKIIKKFLLKAGLVETLKAFECDMLVLNPEFEQKRIPDALKELATGILNPGNSQKIETDSERERTLDERKLDYVHLADGEQPRSQTSINKSISKFLARNRARNDASNRAEFLLSLEEKRRHLQENGLLTEDSTIPSCARTDAKPIDREMQMKYDIAKNEEGPLRRTMKLSALSHSESGPKTAKSESIQPTAVPDEYITADNSGLDERLRNIETHFAVRYVPSPPRTLLSRLKFLEEHIIKLEKEYPPWAALHFNQPNRGWPPPPRATPIIVPAHQRSAEKDIIPSDTSTPAPTAVSTAGQTVASGTLSRLKSKNTSSSLKRAVMERLEVQQALSDLAGREGSSGSRAT